MTQPSDRDVGPSGHSTEPVINRQRSLRLSVWDGAFHAAMVGMGESFFQAFAVFLQATNTQLGLLWSLPQSLGAISQLWAARLLRTFGSRKRHTVMFAFLQALTHLAMAVAIFFGGYSVNWLILWVVGYFVLGNLCAPAWTSWMGDLVDEKERGTYFGRRNAVVGITAFLAMMLAGTVLERAGLWFGSHYIGFALLLVLATIAKIVSVSLLSRQDEPALVLDPAKQFTFMEFLRQAHQNNFGRFVLFMGAMSFSVFVSAPFFVPYMLKSLGMSYIVFTVISAFTLLAKYAVMPFWGEAADRFGTRRTMVVSAVMVPLIPLLWLFGTSNAYILVIQIFSAFAWAGMELLTFQFIFDCTSVQRRGICTAYYNAVNGIAILLGAITGTVLVNLHWFSGIPAKAYLFVFAVSGVLRLLAVVVFLPRIREVRTVEEVGYGRVLMHVMAIGPRMRLSSVVAGVRQKAKDAMKR